MPVERWLVARADPPGAGDRVAPFPILAGLEALTGRGAVGIVWARREGGMIVAPGDPLSLAGAAGLARTGVRERFDLLKRQRGYFKSSPQAQPAAAEPETFRTRAARMGGHGTAATGIVAFNPWRKVCLEGPGACPGSGQRHSRAVFGSK